MKRLLFIPALMLILSACTPWSHPVQLPPYAIYRTSTDYFNNYRTTVDKKGDPVGILMYKMNDGRIFSRNEDTIYALRVRLDSGYVLGGEIHVDDHFTSILIRDIVKMSAEGQVLSPTEIKKSIIDVDPFSEFYTVPNEELSSFHLETAKKFSGVESKYEALILLASDINQLINSGELEDYYKRVK